MSLFLIVPFSCETKQTNRIISTAIYFGTINNTISNGVQSIDLSIITLPLAANQNAQLYK